MPSTTSLFQIALANALPTPPPLPHYSLGGLTNGPLASPPHGVNRPGDSIFISSALERVFQRILRALVSTVCQPYLGCPKRPQVLVATATIPYHLEPSVTLVKSDNNNSSSGSRMPAIIVLLPALTLLVSVLFGVALVFLGRRRGKSPRFNPGISKRESGDPCQKSLAYSDSSTLFCQPHDTTTTTPPNASRISLVWLSVLNFILSGLVFLCRLICLEELLNALNEQNSVAGNRHRFPELRALLRAKEVTRPIQPIVNTDPLSDSNNTLVSPLLPDHAKSKLVQYLLPVVEDGVKIIPLLDVEPACTEIYTSLGCNMATPAVSTSVEPSSAPDKPLPTTVSRPPTPPRIQPLSVEPSGAPDTPTSSNHLSPTSTAGLLGDGCFQTTTPRNQPLSVEPSGVPDKSLAISEPRPSSDCQTVSATMSEEEIESQKRATDTDGSQQVQDEAPFASIAALRERARRTIEHSQADASSTLARIRSKYPSRESQTPSQRVRRPDPGRDKARRAIEEIRKEHEELLSRVHATLKYHDEKRRAREEATAIRAAQRATSSRPKSTLPSKARPLSVKISEIRPRTSAHFRAFLEANTPISTFPQALSTGDGDGVPNEHDSESQIPFNVPDPQHAKSESDVVVQDGSLHATTSEASTVTSEQSSWSVSRHVPPLSTDDEEEKEEEQKVFPWETRQSQITENEIETSTMTDEEICTPTKQEQTTASLDHYTGYSSLLRQPPPQTVYDIFYYEPTTTTPKSVHQKSVQVESYTPPLRPSPESSIQSRAGRSDNTGQDSGPFHTSTHSRVNLKDAHLGEFSTSTPRRDVEHQTSDLLDLFQPTRASD